MDSMAETQYGAVRHAASAGLQRCETALATAALTLGTVLVAWWYGGQHTRQRGGGAGDFASEVRWRHGPVRQILVVEVRTAMPLPTPTLPDVETSTVVDAYEPAPSVKSEPLSWAPLAEFEMEGASPVVLLGEWVDANAEWLAPALGLVLMLGGYGFFVAMVTSRLADRAAYQTTELADTLITGSASSFSVQAFLDGVAATEVAKDFLVFWGLAVLGVVMVGATASPELAGDSASSVSDYESAVNSASSSDYESADDSSSVILEVVSNRVFVVRLPHGKWHLRKEIARVYLEDTEREIGAGEDVEWTIPFHSTKHIVWMFSEGEERERIRKRANVDRRDFVKRLEKREEGLARTLADNLLTEADPEWAATQVRSPVASEAPRVVLPRRADE